MNPAAYADMARTQGSHWWFTARREILRQQIRQLGLPADARILEVGSGTGANLELLAEFGTVVGLEMEPEAIALAQRALADSSRIAMLQGRCPRDLQAIQDRFDLVCMFDVLEHIDEDALSLAGLVRLLRSGGRILVTVPAYPWMWGPHDEHLHHRRRYTRASLRAVCERAGLGVTRISHFNMLLFPLAVAGRMAEKATGRVSGATQTPAAPLNALLRRIFSLERHLLARSGLPFGLSLLLVARPDAECG